jgi:hypothetical protein
MPNEIATHIAAGIIGFASNAGIIFFKRKRTRAINSIRVLTVFFLSNLDKLDLDNETNLKLKNHINDWLQHPNALGSEAQAAKLVAMTQIACNLSETEIGDADRALNALDQRATERERSRDD